MQGFIHIGTDPYFNLALDSYILEHTDFCGFWLWQNAPAVIIGRNQSPYAEVNLPFLRQSGISLARRVTGGGAVYHDSGNLNYSFALPSSFKADAPSLIADILRRMGVQADVSGRNDILAGGRKCSGYARSMHAARTLVHGTLMYSVDLDTLSKVLSAPGSKFSCGVSSVHSRVANLKEYLPFDYLAAFRDALFGALLEKLEASACEFPSAISPAVESLADEKFRSPEWIYGKSPKTETEYSRRLPCGTVTTHYTLRRGVISEIHFTGDFIGSRPVEELEGKLCGMNPQEALKINPAMYFDGVSDMSLLLD